MPYDRVVTFSGITLTKVIVVAVAVVAAAVALASVLVFFAGLRVTDVRPGYLGENGRSVEGSARRVEGAQWRWRAGDA